MSGGDHSFDLGYLWVDQREKDGKVINRQRSPRRGVIAMLRNR
jgi:hypothetical protein